MKLPVAPLINSNDLSASPNLTWAVLCPIPSADLCPNCIIANCSPITSTVVIPTLKISTLLEGLLVPTANLSSISTDEAVAIPIWDIDAVNCPVVRILWLH